MRPLLRAGVILAWFALETPVLHRVKLATTPGTAVLWALHGLAAGCACAACWPSARIGSLHLFFIAGLGLIILTVGARVILGHAGRHDLLGGKIIWLRWMAGLLVLAAATRMSADFLPTVRVSHYIYAAWTWVIAALIWLTAMARYLYRRERPSSGHSPYTTNDASQWSRCTATRPSGANFKWLVPVMLRCLPRS